MINISGLKYDKDGLIPAVVVDAKSGAVLMLANMNEESLRVSIDEGRTCFWSRSRKELWRKGETSGNVQQIVSIKADCDKDALVVAVNKNGPACHTGADSCFFEDVYNTGADGITGSAVDRATDSAIEANAFSLNTLHEIVEDRKINKKPGSYTTYLFEKGLDKILKKLGEESTEVIIAAKSNDKTETIYEIADLIYHTLVLMTEMSITPEDVKRELASRHGEKAEN
jgi:phosphoribosyl-ATP pyrophosphohydrolase/phosphoribosyl-AMP cyclohydrolase